ncbi:methionine-synthesizing 5- methyltetrahydropteroyltriglutamate--homocysteine methyltransferase [Phlyctochytrium bullatum]|nr:methionine-synthesizing 5- methyltetrahydropteroyltriglutamate--homocysteine methyltransferase [Phlyctochytrium bullatum]
MTVISHILGFPRLGANRELKFLVESFWANKIEETVFLAEAKKIRVAHWTKLKELGLDHIPSNDFSFYDHVLDTAVTLGAIPPKYEHLRGLELYFAMARGLQRPATETAPAVDVASLPMSKFFDTNYHYVPVPLGPHTEFKLAEDTPKPVAEFLEAKALGIHTRPAMIGPVSFLMLARVSKEAKDFNKFGLVKQITECYAQLLGKLADAGADWVQLDEPHLALDLSPEAVEAYKTAYAHLAAALGPKSPKLLLTTFFASAESNLALAASLPGVHALHVDLVRAPGQLEAAVGAVKSSLHVRYLSLGVVNGRNVWKTDVAEALRTVKEAAAVLGEGRVMVGPSCSLLHSPHSLEGERKVKAGSFGKENDEELLGWLAFAVEKVQEIVLIAKAVNHGEDSVKDALQDNATWIAHRRNSKRIHNVQVKERVSSISPEMFNRKSPYEKRREIQSKKLNLPLFPTTTIGSFPQTTELRRLRAQHKAGTLSHYLYEEQLREEIKRVVKFQEDLDIDVLVHGEPERNDMVEYFGEMLEGVTFTKNGWVQSYGTRGVKPPIIYGDISRPTAMTVRWSQYAQSLTSRPMKGMLTGPITILCWSFVRDDQPRRDTAFQLALAVRDEVVDLESAGIKVIQIDEPAIREGLPLRISEWDEYLKWAVSAFKLATTGVADETQIHSHMCYSDFEDIMESIISMDCDVLSIESAKSDLKLLQAFRTRAYPNELGPGVFDIHTQRVPPAREMASRVEEILACGLPFDRLWINPDCGLKTRGWTETTGALQTMVQVAKEFRERSKTNVLTV